jgi:hypothetical protein
MVACDSQGCEIVWFHFDCDGISIAPAKGNGYAQFVQNKDSQNKMKTEHYQF